MTTTVFASPAKPAAMLVPMDLSKRLKGQACVNSARLDAQQAEQALGDAKVAQQEGTLT